VIFFGFFSIGCYDFLTKLGYQDFLLCRGEELEFRLLLLTAVSVCFAMRPLMRLEVLQDVGVIGLYLVKPAKPLFRDRRES